MKVSLLALASFDALATALPTSANLELRDARAATLFKHPNLLTVNHDSTFVPANFYCTDISNIFGGFDGKIRSVSVEKGFKCDFYQ
jgi:hypothetical protein